MFCVIYRFTVKPDHEAQFRRHWLAVTKWYYHNAGGLELPRFRGQLMAWHSSRLLIAPLEVQG